jgi:hypothetical protein
MKERERERERLILGIKQLEEEGGSWGCFTKRLNLDGHWIAYIFIERERKK